MIMIKIAIVAYIIFVLCNLNTPRDREYLHNRYVDGGAKSKYAYIEIKTGKLESIDPIFLADALLLIEAFEEIHVNFVIEDRLADDYSYVRESFIRQSRRISNRNDFIFAVQRYLATIRDGHISYRRISPVGLFMPSHIEWRAYNNRLFLVEDDEIAAEIVALGGVDIADILSTIDRYYFSPNEFARTRNLALHARDQGILLRAGAEIEANRIVITLYNGEGYSYREVIFNTSTFNTLLDSPPQGHGLSWELMDDILYIRINSFVHTMELDEVGLAIESAIQSGIVNFIIDLRANPGGPPHMVAGFFDLFGMHTTDNRPMWIHSQWRMVSRVFQSHNPDIPFEPSYGFREGEIINNGIPTIYNPNNAFFAVLTDAFTASAALVFAALVQDEALGIVVGEPSMHSPQPFGTSYTLTLPASGLSISFSHAQTPRPNPQAGEFVLLPDIWVYADFALETALEFFADSIASD